MGAFVRAVVQGRGSGESERSKGDRAGFGYSPVLSRGGPEAEELLPCGLFLSALCAAAGSLIWTAILLTPTGAAEWYLRDAATPATTMLALVLSFVVPTAVWQATLIAATRHPVIASLQMHGALVETNIIVGVGTLLLAATGSPFFLREATTWLAVRTMLGCGACKWASGDVSWRNGTAMHYHYWTMPLPNRLSALAHRAPDWLHRASVTATFIVELPLPFLALVPCRSTRLLGFLGFSGLNAVINVTGNFGFLGMITQVQALPLLLDPGYHDALSPWLLVHLAATLAYVGISLPPTLATFSDPFEVPVLRSLVPAGWTRTSAALDSIEDFVDDHVRPAPLLATASSLYRRARLVRVVNRYAKFASMTKHRHELIFEARDGAEDPWLELQCRWKPGHLLAVPGTTAGVLPELDWMLWFAALGVERKLGFTSDNRLRAPHGDELGDTWVATFVEHLLRGTPAVIDLLAAPYPFASSPPSQIRVQLYEYQFAHPASQAHYRRLGVPPLVTEEGGARDGDTGRIWRRSLAGTVLGPVRLTQTGMEPVPTASSSLTSSDSSSRSSSGLRSRSRHRLATSGGDEE
jgi:hypothetical protein